MATRKSASRVGGIASTAATEYVTQGQLEALAVADITGLQTALDTKAIKATGVLGTGIPWYWQGVVNNEALVTGYNLLTGGAMADRAIVLESMVVWLESSIGAGAVGGTGNLQIQWYAGDIDTQGTLLHTTQMPAGEDAVWPVLGSPVNIDVNGVLRAYFTMGTTTVADPIHIQYRGRYQ